MPSTVQVREEERRRMARLLHDTVGQTIAALQMNLSIVAASEHTLEPLTRQALAECMDLAQACGVQIRSISYDLYPPLLDEAGLLAGLRAYLGDYSRRTGMKVEALLPARLARLPRKTEIGLFRIAQEGLTSIHRISHGPTTLRIRRRAGSLILELIHQTSLSAGDWDLANVREAARLIRSKLVVESTTDSLTLRVALPFAAKVKAS
jgi:signal transduction histidine kinase